MTSRVRDRSSMREERSKVTPSRVKDRLHDGDREDRPLNSGHKGGQGSRYHFGMTGRDEERDEASKNGRDYREHGDVNADELYKKSKEHFGAWDIKDIVQDESSRSRRQTERLTNGRSRAQDDRVDVADVDEEKTGSGVDRLEQVGSHRLRKKERWEGSDGWKISKSGRAGRGDERGDRELSKEMENLSVVDGRSGEDRRIRTMIERFKSREEDKSKLRPREWNSIGSTEREGYGSRGGGRGELRTDRVTDINDRDRGRIQKDDPAEERGPRGSKLGGAEKYEREEVGRSGSVDRRMEKFNDSLAEKRRSKETAFEDDVPRRRENNLRRRSYIYDGNPDDFEVRIQRYERGVAEVGRTRDVDPSKRVSSKESGVDPGRRNSFKEQVTRKSSFNKCCDSRRNSHHSRENRESSKDRENEPCSGKSSFKSQERKYSEHRVSSKEQGYEGGGRKNSWKESDSDYGRILSKNRDDEEERKRSFKGHSSDTGVGRIAFKQQDADSTRVHSCKDREADAGSRVSFDKEHAGRKNSLKEKSVEFGGISYRDHNDEADPRSSAGRDNEARRRRSPNGRYVEFGGVSFQSEGDDSETRASPSNDSERRGWSRRRGCSSRSKNREEGDSDKRSDRHSRPLTPPKREGGEEFDSKAWHESNRIFAANYIRENSRYRANPEGRSEIDRDPSPEFEIQEARDRIHRSCLEEGSNESEDSKARGARKSEENRAYALGKNGEHPPRDGDASRYASSTHEGRNGATIIRIRSSPETGVERRRRRRPAQDAYAGRRRCCENREEGEEDSEEDEEGDDRRGGSRGGDGGFIPGRGVSTPSRRVWNYREGVWHFHESIAFDRSFMVQKREAIFINRWRR